MKNLRVSTSFESNDQDFVSYFKHELSCLSSFSKKFIVKFIILFLAKCFKLFT